MRRSLLLLILFTGCEGAPGTAPALETEARGIVEAFLSSELNGGTLSEATHIYGCEADFQPSSDVVKPVARAEIISSSPMGDTVDVVVRYEVLGLANLGGTSSTFRAGPVEETVTFRVGPDSLGVARIYCGPHPANHWSVETIGRFVPTFDDRSLRQWDNATRGSGPTSKPMSS